MEEVGFFGVIFNPFGCRAEESGPGAIEGPDLGWPGFGLVWMVELHKIRFNLCFERVKTYKPKFQVSRTTCLGF